MGDYYILDGHKAVPCNDYFKWGEWHRTADRKVKREMVGESDVSTVFLGLDHSYGDGPPVLFETLVFDGPLDMEMDRYETWEEAEKGHAAMVERVKKRMAAIENG